MNGARASAHTSALSSLYLGLAGCTAITTVLVLSQAAFQHWFVVPITLCGALMASDAIDWMRGRVDVFDPIGVLGLLGVHVFFFAPLLHVYWDRWISTAYWLAVVPPPSDWRPWLGAMGWLSALGLALYRITRGLSQRWAARRAHTRSMRAGSSWRLAPQRFWPMLGLAVGITALAQVVVFGLFGGLGGFVSAYEQEARVSFAGMGWVFMISESTPILLMFGLAAYARARRWLPSWVTIALIIVAFFALRLIFGGLRGSRSNTIWALLWAVGILHFWVRPIPKRLIVAGLGFLLTFSYLYGFYKSVGRDALRAFEGAAERAELSQQTGRSFQSMLLADLGRSDIQAFILYRQQLDNRSVELAYGRTYLGAATLLVPRALWPERPHTKLREGTELFYGPGSYVPDRFHVSYVYGLAGEAMLNFGWPAVPVALALFGFVVGGVRYRIGWYEPWDARRLAAPLWLMLCVIALVSDSDNVVFAMVKNGAVPVLVLLLGSDRTRPRGRRTDVTATP